MSSNALLSTDLARPGIEIKAEPALIIANLQTFRVKPTYKKPNNLH